VTASTVAESGLNLRSNRSKRGIAAVFRIDIEDNESRDLAQKARPRVELATKLIANPDSKNVRDSKCYGDNRYE
jgi:hypothetical protein